MKNLFLAGMFSIVLVFGLTVVSCNSGGGGDGEGSKKTLVITNISQKQLNATENGITICIFPTGTIEELQTTQLDPSQKELIVAVAEDNDDIKISGGSAPYKATATLLAAPFYKDRWTGSGEYDICIYLVGRYHSQFRKLYYYKENVSFTSAKTSIDARTLEEEIWEYPW